MDRAQLVRIAADRAAKLNSGGITARYHVGGEAARSEPQVLLKAARAASPGSALLVRCAVNFV